MTAFGVQQVAITLSYASKIVLRMKAAALASVMSRWKRLRRLGIGAPLPKQGRRDSCISATVATIPSATLRAYSNNSSLHRMLVAAPQYRLARQRRSY